MSGSEMHGGAIDAALCKQFESAWIEGNPQPIERFLPSEEEASFTATLEELVAIELELSWKSWWSARQRDWPPTSESGTPNSAASLGGGVARPAGR